MNAEAAETLLGWWVRLFPMCRHADGDHTHLSYFVGRHSHQRSNGLSPDLTSPMKGSGFHFLLNLQRV